MTGLLNIDSQQWDEDLVAVMTNATDPHQRGLSANGLKGALGTPRRGTAPVGRVSSWLTKRFLFDPSCVVMSSIPSHLASYFSHLPHYGDIGLQLGNDDYLIVPTTTPVFVAGGSVVPHPLAKYPFTHSQQTSNSGQPPPQTHLVIAKASGAGLARKTIRDVYTNANWDAFQKLMSAVCAGGSIGMDNKVSVRENRRQMQLLRQTDSQFSVCSSTLFVNPSRRDKTSIDSRWVYASKNSATSEPMPDA